MPICPAGTGSAAPTSGSAVAGSSMGREISVTAGLPASSSKGVERSVLTRATPGRPLSDATKPGEK